jgi:hypothetical protein
MNAFEAFADARRCAAAKRAEALDRRRRDDTLCLREWRRGRSEEVSKALSGPHNALVRTLKRIMTASSASDLPPEGYIAGGSECEMCPWAGQCGVERRQVPASDKAEIDTSFAGEIAALARNKKTLEAEIDRLGAEVRAVEIDIRSRLRSRDVRRIEADGIMVAWSAVRAGTAGITPASSGG